MKYDLEKRVEEEIINFAKKNGIKKVVLFGSRARCQNSERSDIDLAVSGGNALDFYYDLEENEFFKSFNICTIGDYFYSLYNNDLYSKTFIKDDNGEFVGFDTPFSYGINERQTPYYEPFEIPYVKSFDYCTTLEKTKESQNADIH